MRLRVGLTSLAGSIEEYAKRFDLLELRSDPQRLPSDRALRRLKAGVGESVQFSLLIPAEITRRALENTAELAGTLVTAEALQAAWLVFQTGPTVGPSERTRARFQALLAAVTRPPWRIAWEPRGPFEPEVAQEWCDSLGITLVEDLSHVDATPGAAVYTRLRAEGPGARLTGGAIEQLAQQIASVEEAWVVLEGRPSPKARARIQQAVESQLGLDALGPAGDDLEDDEEGDDEVEGEDDDRTEGAGVEADLEEDLEADLEDEGDEEGTENGESADDGEGPTEPASGDPEDPEEHSR
jgi:uncharacterized protein YecE (DUF72 family)